MAKFLTADPGFLLYFRRSSLQQSVMAESCKGLHLMGLTFAEHVSCQTHRNARYYTKNCLHSIQRLYDYHHGSINFRPTFISLKLTKETIEQEAKYLQS